MQVTFGELKAFLEDHFPQGTAYGTLEELGDGWAEMKLEVDDGHLRPGGTVSGPVMMGLADVAMYAALLGKIGLVPLAVTTNFNINFMRKPAPDRDVIGEAQLLKLGRRLAVAEGRIYSDGDPELVAHATRTYSIPPRSD